MIAPPTLHPALVRSLRADLETVGYTVEGIADDLGPVASAALHREQRLPADLATRGRDDPIAVLVRLFALGFPVAWTSVVSALPTLGPQGAVDLGLARAEGADLRATCDLRPYADEDHRWWIASDLSEIATGEPLDEHHVLGIGPASTTLAQWTIRRRVGTALDVGTGSAVQALHLADHSDTVVGTDISARALAFATFNTALNDVDVDLRQGSLWDPVGDQRYDLVVSNPPFVITPRGVGLPQYEYRDAGLVGDGVVEALVRTVGEHLTPGGVAQFLGNWEIPKGADWRERWRSWLSETGLDAWVVQRDVQDPAQYAELWSGDSGSRMGVVGYERRYAAWLSDFADRDVERIGFGIVTLQRPATPRAPWVELVEAPGPVAGGMGPTVEAGLSARSLLAERGPDVLLDTAWRVAPDVVEERLGRPGATDLHRIVVRQYGGLRRAVDLDTATAGVLGVCDGTLTARAAVHAVAAVMDVEAAEVLAGALPVLERLVQDGLLVR